MTLPAEPHGLRLALRHWRLVAFLALGFGPLLPSILAMRQFFLADNALGFVPFVIAIAAVTFWRRSFPEARPGRRDLVVDCFVALPPGAAAIYTLYAMPDTLSWYFWLYRVDLLALPFMVLCAGAICFGYQRVLLAAPAYLVLFLVWPYPIVRIQQLLVGPFLGLTTLLTGWAVDFLALPYVQDAASPQHFVSTHAADPHNFELILAEACSGTATFMAFMLFAIASAAFVRGEMAPRLRWIATGVGLALAINVLRVILLMFTAVAASADLAVEVIHPALGVLLFGGLVVLMLMLVRPFGLEFDPGYRGGEAAWISGGTGGGPALLVLTAVVVGVAAIVGVLDMRVQRYAFIDLGQGAPIVNPAAKENVLVEVPGWHQEHLAELSWTDLFGRTARGDLISYQPAAGGPAIVVQTILTEDKATLDRYPVEQCVLFHNDIVEDVRRVALPLGTTGALLRTTDGRLQTTALAWQFPVQVDGQVWHARVLLLLDTEEPMVRVADGPEVRALAEALGASLEPPPPDADVERQRAHVDLQVTALASAMIRQLVPAGG